MELFSIMSPILYAWLSQSGTTDSVQLYTAHLREEEDFPTTTSSFSIEFRGPSCHSDNDLLSKDND